MVYRGSLTGMFPAAQRFELRAGAVFDIVVP